MKSNANFAAFIILAACLTAIPLGGFLTSLIGRAANALTMAVINVI